MSRRWCFTVNNYTDADEASIKAWDTKYLIFGHEVGDNGTPHLQGFATFPKLYRLSGVKKLHSTAHWEVARGTSKEASDYCKKEDASPFERGIVPVERARNDLLDLTEAAKSGVPLKEICDIDSATYARNYRAIAHIRDLYSTAYGHHDVRGVWFYGGPGTGKSHTARSMYPNAYLKDQNKWFDGYAGEAVIILDDLDFGGRCLGHKLKIWLDKYPCSAEVKGGKVELQHRVFIITSNYTPDEIFGRRDDDKDSGQEMMVAAITRRIQFFHFTSVFVPPLPNQAAPGNWSPDVSPPLPTGFYSDTVVIP